MDFAMKIYLKESGLIPNNLQVNSVQGVSFDEFALHFSIIAFEN